MGSGDGPGAEGFAILQMVEANSVCTLSEYYKLGLSMGVSDDVLTRNATKIHRMEMLVAARLMNSQLDVPDFFCDYLNWCMSMDMRQAYENKRFMQPLDLPLNMDDWQPSSSTERRQTIFENALFSFASILCAVDHLNHANAIEPNDEERKMPTSLELMQLENEDELFNSRYDILVNEFLFQFGIQIDYLKKMGEETFPHSEPSLWDMRMLLYKLMREIWLETTDRDPIGKMNKFTFFITNVVNKCVHSRTLCLILIFLLPHRLMDVSPDDINWVRDSLFDGWQEEGTNIVNKWGCHHGFVIAACPPGGPESDGPPGSKRRKQVRAFRKGIHAKFNSDLDFTITFDPDADEFIESIVRDNKMYSCDTLDFLKKYEI